MKPTMSDVGRLAGVTKMTVSRALRNPHSVRAETLLRVRKAASELNYRRSKSRTQSLTLVWLMFRPENDPNSSSELLAYQIDGANDASLQRNFSLQMVYFDEKQPLDALLWRISTRNADGVLLAADHPDMLPLQFEMEDLVQCIEKMAIPLVAVGASSRLLHTNRIYKNDVAGSYAAVSHLLQLGHRRIAFSAELRRSIRAIWIVTKDTLRHCVARGSNRIRLFIRSPADTACCRSAWHSWRLCLLCRSRQLRFLPSTTIWRWR